MRELVVQHSDLSKRTIGSQKRGNGVYSGIKKKPDLLDFYRIEIVSYDREVSNVDRGRI